MSISKQQLWIIFIAFIISGIAGLVYESVWSHYLGLYLGHAALAQTLTLAIFMGGMAFGSWLIMRNNHNIKNAVLLYALIELVLGVLGLIFHGVFDATIHFSYESIFPSIGSPFIINMLKWFIASLMILPQSILLGATFPLLSSGIIRRSGQAEGGMISMLYFTNSLGAAFGAILATFILIPQVGMPGALLIAGLLNIFVAIAVYTVSKTEEPIFNAQRSKELQNSQEVNISKRLILSVALFTGFASFVYEISWIRMLNQILGTTLHSFEIMLSAFILGLALGGFWIRKRIDKIKNIPRYLGVIQILMGAMALLTMPLYIESFSWVAEILKNVLKVTDSGYSFYNILTAVLAMLIMMPAAFFAGMTLPLLTMTLMKKGENEKAIGKVYAFNTLGALLGVWFAIHVGMVYLGLKYLLIFGSIFDFVLGILLFTQSSKTRKLGFAKLAPIFYLTVLVMVIVVADFSPKTLASGTYRYARDSFPDNVEMLFYKDGKSASISVTKEVGRKDGDIFVISTNGKPDAGVVIGNKDGYSGDEPTMILAGALPLLVKPDATHAANIGFGSGLTANTLLGSEIIERLDTIEIEPKMVEGAKLFAERNRRVYEDSRSNIVIDDAKTYFASNNMIYDFIVSEPSNPWVMGVGNLFTKEFYRHIKNYLKDDGILVQWLQLYEISPEVIATAFNALSTEFKYYDLYRSNQGDVIMLVSDAPIPDFQFNDFSELPELVADDLSRIGINNLDLIKSRYAGSKQEMERLFKFHSKGVNSDYFPILSLKAPKDRFKRVNSINLFAYTNFGLPMFELLNDFDIDSLNIESHDLHHPFLRDLDFAKSRYEAIFSDQINIDTNLAFRGHVGILNSSEQFCGLDKDDEEKWLSSLLVTITETSILGSSYPLNILNKSDVEYCLNKSIHPDIPKTLRSLKYFYQNDYSTYLKISNQQLVNDGTDFNKQIEKVLHSHGLFAILQLQKSGTALEIDLSKYVTSDEERWSMSTPWLMSQLKDYY